MTTGRPDSQAVGGPPDLQRIFDSKLARHYLEFLLNIASVEAIAALTAMMLTVLDVPAPWPRGSAIAISVLYFLYGILAYRLGGKNIFAKLSSVTMCLLAVEASIALFQVTCDPKGEMPPWLYLLLLWIMALVVYNYVSLSLLWIHRQSHLNTNLLGTWWVAVFFTAVWMCNIAYHAEDHTPLKYMALAFAAMLPIARLLFMLSPRMVDRAIERWKAKKSRSA